MCWLFTSHAALSQSCQSPVETCTCFFQSHPPGFQLHRSTGASTSIGLGQTYRFLLLDFRKRNIGVKCTPGERNPYI